MSGKNGDLSRRDFIKAAGVSAALGGGLLAGGAGVAQASQALFPGARLGGQPHPAGYRTAPMSLRGWASPANTAAR